MRVFKRKRNRDEGNLRGRGIEMRVFKRNRDEGV